MEKEYYKITRSLLDTYSVAILRELPNKFTTRQFLEKVRLIFAPKYGEAILQFGGEKKLIAWVYQYYLLRRPKNVKQQEHIRYDGFCLVFNPKPILEKVWLKVKR